MDKAFELVYDQEEEEVLEEILKIYLQQYYLVNIDKTSDMLDFDDFFEYASECPDWNDHFKDHLQYDTPETIRMKMKLMTLYPVIQN